MLTAVKLKRASIYRLARYLLWVWMLVIIYVSLQPFSGWHRPVKANLWSFLWAAKPRYITWFDLSINYLAYVPLGIFALPTFRAYTQVGMALTSAVLLGMGLSIAMESLQVLLPTRIASNIDVITNTLGTFTGALMVLASRRWLIWQWLIYQYLAWFRVEYLFGLMLLWLWLGTQANPSLPLLAMSGMPSLVWVDVLADFPWLNFGVIVLNLLGLSALTRVVLQPHRPVNTVVFVFLLMAILMKWSLARFLLKPTEIFHWFNLASFLAIVVGLYVSWELRRVALPVIALLGALALSAVVALGELWTQPLIQKSLLQLFSWKYGQLLNYNRLSAIIARLWPALVAIYLLWAAWHDPVVRRAPPSNN